MYTKVITTLLFITMYCFNVPVTNGQSLLEQYVRQGLENNLGLKQQKLQLDKSIYALQQAKSYFLPQVSLIGGYNKAGGGRTIDFPTGDLLNGVYSSLNQLTGQNNFPQLSNQSILLNPDKFYDAKFRTTLQLINAEIWLNKRMRKELITQQEAAVNVYKRELVKDIREAYYRYLQATQAINIYEQAMLVVNENIRINESMVKNGVRNPTALTRSKAEKEKIQAQITEAMNKQVNARNYFNFLINQPLDNAVNADTSLLSQLPTVTDENLSTSNREELTQLQQARKVNQINNSLQKAYIIPKLNTYLDLGSQGFDWQFDNKSRYYLWGVNLQWDLFAGGFHRSQIRQSQADISSINAQLDQTEKALLLEAQQAYNNYKTAVSSYNNALSQKQFSEQYYNDQLKVYKEGQLLYIELLDAQNQLTSARIQASVAIAQVHIAATEIERATASYTISSNK